jgi:hypothetical protein
MGFFSSTAGRVLAGVATGGLSEVGRALVGDGGRQPAAQNRNPALDLFNSDVARVRGVAEADAPTEVDASGKVLLEQAEADRGLTKDKLADQQAGAFAKGQQALSLSGGSSQGGRERLARQGQNAGIFAQQGAEGDFNRIFSQIRSNNLGSQEQFRRQAILQTPQLQGGGVAAQGQQTAANAQAQALANAQRGQRLGAIGGLIGGGLGLALSGGNPAAAGLGSSAGSGIFSSFG